MEDLKKIQEFFSKPLEESDYSPMGYAKKVANGEMSLIDARKESNIPYAELAALVKKINPKFSAQVTEISKESAWKEFQEKRHVTDKTAAAARKDFDKGWDEGKFRDGKYMSMEEAETPVSEDIPDIIAVDVPLFIRLLEFAREDAGDDMDLHEVAERAIEAVKARGVLSMDDYDTLILPKEELDEKMLVPKDKIDRMARDIAAKYFTSKADKGEAIEILKQAVRDAYRAIDPEAEIQEAEGYSPQLVSPKNPKGKTQGLDSETMSKILMKIMQDIEETKQLGENLNEELCPKGKAYIKKRMAAGEKSSAYLSGRAVKVCKGQMKG